MVKKRKTIAQETGETSTKGDEEKNEDTNNKEHDLSAIPRTFPFKNSEFLATRASSSSSRKSRTWKTLKQIIANEKPQAGTGITYAALDAPPTTKPLQKYSDISGIPTTYKDPVTKLYYANIDEFSQIRMLSQDIINGYLELRKANT